MRRQSIFGLATAAVALLGGPAALAVADDLDETGARLAALLRAGRSVISNHQALINDPTVGEKNLDGERVAREAAALYAEREGAPPLTEDTADLDRRLIEAQLAAMREVVDEHQQLIDAEDLGFKGFIPAVFGRLVNERFAEKAGDVALVKVTAPPELVRNRKALPDAWEAHVLETRVGADDWPRGEPYTEHVEQNGRPAFRMLIPEYYSGSCLACHGEPKGELDVTGYPKEGGREGELGGAISITLFK